MQKRKKPRGRHQPKGLTVLHEDCAGHLARRTRLRALGAVLPCLHKNDSAPGAFYRRINGRHGPAKAITVTAHKLAKLVYRMLKHGEEYVRKGQKSTKDNSKRRNSKTS